MLDLRRIEAALAELAEARFEKVSQLKARMERPDTGDSFRRNVYSVLCSFRVGVDLDAGKRGHKYGCIIELPQELMDNPTFDATAAVIAELVQHGPAVTDIGESYMSTVLRSPCCGPDEACDRCAGGAARSRSTSARFSLATTDPFGNSLVHPGIRIELVSPDGTVTIVGDFDSLTNIEARVRRHGRAETHGSPVMRQA